MTRKRAHHQDEAGETSQASNDREEARADQDARHRNGPTAGPQAPDEPAPTMHRAEEAVDRMAERIGHYAGAVGRAALWLFARAREEAEDIWAEAQSIRESKQRREGSSS
jgi:hypothetical protein